ncbi:MAG: discoidin domain-containing protein [Sedimentisphaerales bacterium]|jgi:hypothetical protein
MKMHLLNSMMCVALLLAGCAETLRSSRIGEYKNLALNPNDTRGPAVTYPHATSNSECRNEICYAAQNVIDGNTANRGHGPKFPSWGPDKRTDLWLKIDFGRKVEADKVVIYIRADFPHDAYWKGGTIEFSDGSKEKISFQKTATPQEFKFTPRRIEWLRITDLVQDEPLGWCGFAEVEVWGRED